jgi:hypothetical protein
LELNDLFILISAGLLAGFVNTIAGGGSMITLPVLIFAGLTPTVANATNRIAILFQNISAIYGFHSAGLRYMSRDRYLLVFAVLGSTIGAYLATIISDHAFQRIISVVIIVISGISILGYKSDSVKKFRYTPILSSFFMFLIGIYGGFIQIGVGFLFLAELVAYEGRSIADSNFMKVTIVFAYTVAVIFIFQFGGLINWKFGLVLAIGNTLGAFVASRYSALKGDKWAKKVIFIALIGVAIKLLFE